MRHEVKCDGDVERFDFHAMYNLRLLVMRTVNVPFHANQAFGLKVSCV